MFVLIVAGTFATVMLMDDLDGGCVIWLCTVLLEVMFLCIHYAIGCCLPSIFIALEYLGLLSGVMGM